MTVEEMSSVSAEKLGDKYSLDSNIWEVIDRAYPLPCPGIYRLHVLDERRSGFLPLPRLLGEDAQGIIYIGTSAAVPAHVGSLRKSVNAAYWQVDAKTYAHLPYRDVTPHPTGLKIARIPRFVERFPFARLCVTIERYSGTQEALDVDVKDYGHTELETRLLQDYEKQYGEKPALNS